MLNMVGYLASCVIRNIAEELLKLSKVKAKSLRVFYHEAADAKWSLLELGIAEQDVV